MGNVLEDWFLVDLDDLEVCCGGLDSKQVCPIVLPSRGGSFLDICKYITESGEFS